MPITAGTYVTDGTVTWLITDTRDTFPCGFVALLYSVPTGWVKANGATANRADYPRLIKYVTDNNLWDSTGENEAIYGLGDGTTTFVLPNLVGRFFEAANTAGTLVPAALPNVTGQLGPIAAMQSIGMVNGGFAGAFYLVRHHRNTSGTSNGSADAVYYTGFNAARCSSIYDSTCTTVQPNSVQLIPCIKY